MTDGAGWWGQGVRGGVDTFKNWSGWWKYSPYLRLRYTEAARPRDARRAGDQRSSFEGAAVLLGGALLAVLDVLFYLDQLSLQEVSCGGAAATTTATGAGTKVLEEWGGRGKEEG